MADHSERPEEISSGRIRILAIRSGALGDFILTLPVLARLKRARPGCEITLISRSSFGRLASSCGFADRAIDENRGEVVALYGGGSVAFADFFGRFDLVVSFVPAAGLREGLLRSGGGEFLCAAPKPPEPGTTHAADHLMTALRPIGVELPAVPAIHPPIGELDRARLRLAEAGLAPGRFVMIHPGSGSERKNWPLDRFTEVACRTRSELGLGVAVVAGPAEEELLGPGGLREAFRGSANAIFLSDPPLEVAALASYSACFVGNDSGLSHLAAAAGARVVAVFGPTDPAVWSPRGRSVAVLKSASGKLESVGVGEVFGRVAAAIKT